MKNIVHYSFDLWYTLIKSNPIFKQERAKYFYTNYNTLGKTLQEVEIIFRDVDLMCNATNQISGQNIDAEEMYLMVLYQLNNGLEPFTKLNLQKLYATMEKLLLQYLPSLFDANTKNVLQTVAEKQNTTLNILSNTAFVKGSTLQIILQRLDIAQYFQFQIYSDQVGVSKPNTAIFNLLLQQVNALHKKQQIVPNQIVHIGDNVIADIAGAKKIGIQTLHINTNSKTILHVLK